MAALVFPEWGTEARAHNSKVEDQQGHTESRECSSKAGFNLCYFSVIPAKPHMPSIPLAALFMMTQWRIRPGHLTMRLFPMILCLHSFPSSQKHESGAMTARKPSMNCLAEFCLATQLYHSTTHRRPASMDKNSDIKTKLEMP